MHPDAAPQKAEAVGIAATTCRQTGLWSEMKSQTKPPETKQRENNAKATERAFLLSAMKHILLS